MTHLRHTIAALLAAIVGAAAVGAASAASEPAFGLVEAGSASFPDRAYVITLDGKQELSADDVTVTENGKPVESAAVQTAAGAGGIGTVLLIDSSNSMKGSIDDAMLAARTFAARNPGQPLSVITFNARPTVALPFTTDRKQAQAVLARTPKLAEGTAMYDALAAAVAQARDSGLGAVRVVLLSDGDDVGSVTSEDSALGQLADQRIRVFTVGIASPALTASTLERIADETGGSYAEAGSSSALEGVYDALGFQLGNEYLLVYRSPAAPGKDVRVEVAIAGQGSQSTTFTTPETGSSAPYTEPFLDKLLQSPLLLLGIAAAVVALLYYAVRTLARLRTNRRLRTRLGDFVTLPEEEQARERRQQVDDLLTAAQAQTGGLRKQSWFRRFTEDCDIGEITMSPKGLIAVSLVGGFLVALVASVAFGPWWGLVGLLVPILVNGEVKRRAEKTRNLFAEQMPENLEVMASSLRAGHSLAGSMAVVVEQAADPSRTEFRRVVTDEALGVTLDDALEVTARRMRNNDLEQVAMVSMLQREAGGNMAEVLDQVVINVRARMDLRRMVRVLTAQGKISLWILSAIPLALMLFLLMINPDHLQPLFHDPVGQVGLVMAGIAVALGWMILKRIVNIEL